MWFYNYFLKHLIRCFFEKLQNILDKKFQQAKTPAVNPVKVLQAVDECNFLWRGFNEPTSSMFFRQCFFFCYDMGDSPAINSNSSTGNNKNNVFSKL